MQFISSDTNIWLDFSIIGYLGTPFLLRDLYTFLMSADTMDKELMYPSDLRSSLLNYGLQRTELLEEEYILAVNYTEKYPHISSYDAFALAIAKHRGIILLSGDGALRKAAQAEGVEVHGTIWVVDLLKEQRKIEREEYREILQALADHCGKGVFLPLDELRRRLDECINSF